MIIRATAKVLSISGIKPVKNENTEENIFPSEWYASILKTGFTGKLLVHFFHPNTKLSLLCRTKSLNVALKQLPESLKNFLDRQNLDVLYPKFEMETNISIYTSNSKRALGYINELHYNMECNIGQYPTYDSIDLEKIEDIYAKFPLSTVEKKFKYETPLELLKQQLQ